MTPVIWTPKAENTFQAQLDYLEENWPEVTLRLIFKILINFRSSQHFCQT